MPQYNPKEIISHHPTKILHTPIHGLSSISFPERFDIKGFRNDSKFKKSKDKTQIKVKESKLFLHLMPITQLGNSIQPCPLTQIPQWVITDEY